MIFEDNRSNFISSHCVYTRIVGAFSDHRETSRRFVDSPYTVHRGMWAALILMGLDSIGAVPSYTKWVAAFIRVTWRGAGGHVVTIGHTALRGSFGHIEHKMRQCDMLCVKVSQ